MKFLPRSPESLDHSLLWDKGVVQSRIEEITKLLVSEYAVDDMRRIAGELKRKFQPVPPYPFSDGEILEKFSEKAKNDALKLLEEERQKYVAFKSPCIKNVLQQVTNRLRNLVFDIDDDGKVRKSKITTERMSTFRDGDWDLSDVQYVGDRDVERFNQIMLLQSRLSGFSDYAPYFNSELGDLWKKLNELGTLERETKA